MSSVLSRVDFSLLTVNCPECSECLREALEETEIQEAQERKEGDGERISRLQERSL